MKKEDEVDLSGNSTEKQQQLLVFGYNKVATGEYQQQPYPDKEEHNHSQKAQEALCNAGKAYKHMLPTFAYMGLKGLLRPQSGGYLRGFDQSMGLLILLASPPVEAVKIPIAGVVGTYRLFESAIHRLLSIFDYTSSLWSESNAKRQMETSQIAEIEQSFIQRLENTLGTLVALGIDDLENIQKQFEQGDIQHYVTIALLITAYQSSALHSTDQIALANGKILNKADCPAKGLPLFNAISEISSLLKKILPENKKGRIEARIDFVDKYSKILLDALEDDNHEIKLSAAEKVIFKQFMKLLSNLQSEADKLNLVQLIDEEQTVTQLAINRL